MLILRLYFGDRRQVPLDHETALLPSAPYQHKAQCVCVICRHRCCFVSTTGLCEEHKRLLGVVQMAWDFTMFPREGRACEAAEGQSVLTALAGFLDRTLDLSFGSSPVSSFFSGSFTVLCISFSETTGKKEDITNCFNASCYLVWFSVFAITCWTDRSQVFVEFLVIPSPHLFQLA